MVEPHTHHGCCGAEESLPPKPVSLASAGCCGHDHEHGHDHEAFDLRRELIPIVIATVLLLVGLIFHDPLHNTPFAIAEYLVLMPAYLMSGGHVLTTAGRNILRGRIFDENFLMTIATLGAIAIHELPEAVGVMLFFQVGEMFQGYSVGRSRRSIQALLEVRPDHANLKVNGAIASVSPDVVIMTDAPSKVAEAIQIAHRTLRIVWQNIVLALTVKGHIYCPRSHRDCHAVGGCLCQCGGGATGHSECGPRSQK